ncbi:HAD-like protein [Schizopora paradoxa]|uniref:HAD-like protein n=1 Tax=Schizopora paradoxa TaxID=27342 RepID=A0A0H2SFD4_9AGAM|nr:HAD-like protein [Schizopora paradoxa]
MSSKIEYVIFDLDGLLIDSERVYTKVTNDILAEYGKTMTWDIKAGLMGKPEREAAQHLLSFFPGLPLTIDAYLKARDEAQDRIWPTVQPLPGAVRLVQHLKAHGIPIAIATGTRRRNLDLKTGHLPQLMECFGENIICADDTISSTNIAASSNPSAGEAAPSPRIKKGRGKPCPDIFLIAAHELLGRPVGLDEDDATEEAQGERAKGLVFEDAIPGVEAGKRAGMSVVWVPDAGLLEVEYPGPHKADETIRSLEDFVPEKWGLPPYPVDH